MKGWAERMNIEIAKILEADIATAIWKEDCYNAHDMGFHGKIFEIHPDFRRGLLGFLRMKWAFFRSNITQDYDTILFSNEAITGIHSIRKGTKTMYYAHSISRHLFDLKEDYEKKVPKIIRPFYRIANFLLKELYIWELQKIDVIFVNSLTNKNRIKEWIWRDDAIILPPPVDTKAFSPHTKENVENIIQGIWLNYKDYYISFARLTHVKRIDSIIRTFQQFPDKKVLILYGPHDSQKNEFIQLGTGYPNIIFHTLSDNNLLPTFISWAIASIAVSKQEDFWMVAIESMACGVPVIAVQEWWFQESILDGITGQFISPNDIEGVLGKSIQSFDSTRSKEMEQSCINHSKNYSLEKFSETLLSHIQKLHETEKN